jgi:hypothetical protein
MKYLTSISGFLIILCLKKNVKIFYEHTRTHTHTHTHTHSHTFPLFHSLKHFLCFDSTLTSILARMKHWHLVYFHLCYYGEVIFIQSQLISQRKLCNNALFIPPRVFLLPPAPVWFFVYGFQSGLFQKYSPPRSNHVFHQYL